MMILQFFHQADLCLLLNRLVGRSVFSYTESIVCPDELDGHFHQCGHTDSGLHIVGEYEECTASGDNATMQIHTYAHASHCQLGNAGLEEGTVEVVGLQ